MFPWYFSTAGPGQGTPIRQGVTADKQKLLSFLFACLSVFWADIPLIESNPCFEGNFIAKLVLKTDQPTNRPTSLGLDASSRGIKIVYEDGLSQYVVLCDYMHYASMV
jgi:hypothetical protein